MFLPMRENISLLRKYGFDNMEQWYEKIDNQRDMWNDTHTKI